MLRRQKEEYMKKYLKALGALVTVTFVAATAVSAVIDLVLDKKEGSNENK